jgi:hypothetical protein
MSEPVLDWNKIVHTNVLTSDKHNAGSVIASQLQDYGWF